MFQAADYFSVVADFSLPSFALIIAASTTDLSTSCFLRFVKSVACHTNARSRNEITDEIEELAIQLGVVERSEMCTEVAYQKFKF